MDYTTITDTSSLQWELRQQAYTDENGLRKIDDKYCVALGTYYAEECGEEFVIKLDTGISFEVIVGDIKHDDHTDESNRYSILFDSSGNSVYNNDNILMVNVVEFIVDTNELPKEVIQLGDVSSLGFEGNIVEIKEIKYTYDFN